MKLKHKIYISACGFIVLQIFFLTFFVLAPIASAEFTIKTPAGKEITLEEAKINIPFESLSNEMKVTSDDIQPCEDGGDTLCLRIPWVAKYIGALYRYGVIFGSILAVVMIMIGGILYLIGGMNQTMISKGKGYIVGAVTGLILLLGSYVLLNTINPRLINLQPIKVEIAKEQKADQVKFCNELKVADYNFDPPLNQLRCGDESNYSLKDSDIVHEGTCIGDVCSNPKEWCMPKDRKDSGDYTCREVAIWGYFHEDGGRFLDCLWVNSLEGFSDPDNKNKDSSYEKGDKVYWVTKKELELSSTKHYYVLRVELNDTGMTRAKVTNSDIVKYGQAVATWVGIPGTFDDEYYLAIDPKTMKQDGQGRTIAEAIWMEPCKNATVVRYRKEGEKNAWMSEADQQERLYKRIDDFYLSGKGLRLDIYADRTVEDSDVSCLVANLLAPARKAVGEECGNDQECASGDCEKEWIPSLGWAQKCECNNDQDCLGNEICLTDWATWNRCASTRPGGATCNEDNQCSSGECSGSACLCKDYSDCIGAKPFPSYCQELSSSPSSPSACAVFRMTFQYHQTTGVACSPLREYKGSNSALSSIVEHGDLYCYGDCSLTFPWYFGNQADSLEHVEKLQEKEAKCMCYWENYESVGCPKGYFCVEVEDGCGWNYCLKSGEKIPSVEQGYNATEDSNTPDWHGLCSFDDDCRSGVCKEGWGANGCAACK